MVIAERVKRLAEADEIAWDKRSLMNQLVERMLAVGAWLAPVDRSGVCSRRVRLPAWLFAVALHRQLLEIGRKALEILVVGQNGNCLSAEEVVVP